MLRKSIIFISLVSLVAVSPMVRADATPDASLDLIRKNCVLIQSNLARLHASDALARVYLGREYETILTKLMTPMNSRVALNKFDGSDMIRTTSDFNTMLAQFRSVYQQYDESMTSLSQVKCQTQPDVLLTTLAKVRNNRQATRDTVMSLSALTEQYRNELQTLKSNIERPAAPTQPVTSESAQ